MGREGFGGLAVKVRVEDIYWDGQFFVANLITVSGKTSGEDLRAWKVIAVNGKGQIDLQTIPLQNLPSQAKCAISRYML